MNDPRLAETAVPGAKSAPLDGLRIIDLSTYVARPSGTMTLAQIGAEVIRVDPIGGATDIRPQRRMAQIEMRRGLWAEKVINGSVPDDIGRQKQNDLTSQLVRARHEVGRLAAVDVNTEGTLNRALDLLRDLRRSLPSGRPSTSEAVEPDLLPAPRGRRRQGHGQ